ncbi:hypothetical protein HK096_000720 [Nowakowskiella sp. JEL0078]|nr:hypothetical protein HK096_000720 [Nowakowskiella sp. JEL0078]
MLASNQTNEKSSVLNQNEITHDDSAGERAQANSQEVPIVIFQKPAIIDENGNSDLDSYGGYTTDDDGSTFYNSSVTYSRRESFSNSTGNLKHNWPPASPNHGSNSKESSHLSSQWPPNSQSHSPNTRETSHLTTQWPPKAPIGIDIPDLSVSVPGQSTDYIVKHKFFPSRSDEIPLEVGDLVAIECRWDDGWVRVQNVTRGRKRGVVPINALKEIRSGPSRRVQSYRSFADAQKVSNSEGIKKKAFVAKSMQSSSSLRADSEARMRRPTTSSTADFGKMEPQIKSPERDSDEEDEKKTREEAFERLKVVQRVSSLWRGEATT